MGNCLRLGISRIGLAWSKWRMAAKFKRKNISIIILGMQATGKSTIALRLYKFKRTLPDTKYVQTKGFNTFTVKKKKTTVNIYDLGGHPSIQELWDHYYADAHGVIFVVDTSSRDTVPEAGQLLRKVLCDYRIRGKPVLLLANKIDLDGVSETELDSMLNLQQLVNSVRCLTRLDVSSATDLKNDGGIFEGFKWLVTFIESNYLDLNNRVLSDTLEEKNREKARREGIKAQRLAEIEKEEEAVEMQQPNGTPVLPALPSLKSPPINPTPPRTAPPSRESLKDVAIPNLVQEEPQQESPKSYPRHFSPPPQLLPPAEQKVIKTEYTPPSKIPLPLLPPINQIDNNPQQKLRLKSPKSKPEIINRIEDHEPPSYDEKGFRFRKISARRLSPEGADSDDGILNMAYEPTEDISSDSTPIGGRRHNFSDEQTNKELFMVTTFAEVHKEYFNRKGSTSTHDSVSMSVASEADSIQEEPSKQENEAPKKSSKGKPKNKRVNIKSRSNKTAPIDPIKNNGEILRNFPTQSYLPLDNLNQSSSGKQSRNSSAGSKAGSTLKKPLTIANAWDKKEAEGSKVGGPEKY